MESLCILFIQHSLFDTKEGHAPGALSPAGTRNSHPSFTRFMNFLKWVEKLIHGSMFLIDEVSPATQRGAKRLHHS